MEPPRITWAPTEPNAWGDAPAARATMRKGRIPSAKTRRKRGDNANGIDKRGRCKGRRAEAPRKIGQGLHQEGARDGMGERLQLGLKLRNIRETGVGPRKGKNTGERPELSKTSSRSEDHQETRRQLQGAKRSLRQRFKAHPEGSRAKHQ